MAKKNKIDWKSLIKKYGIGAAMIASAITLPDFVLADIMGFELKSSLCLFVAGIAFLWKGKKA